MCVGEEVLDPFTVNPHLLAGSSLWGKPGQEDQCYSAQLSCRLVVLFKEK